MGEERHLQRNNNIELNENENLWDTAKAVLRVESTVISEYIRKEDTPQINNLSSRLKSIGKE